MKWVTWVVHGFTKSGQTQVSPSCMRRTSVDKCCERQQLSSVVLVVSSSATFIRLSWINGAVQALLVGLFWFSPQFSLVYSPACSVVLIVSNHLWSSLYWSCCTVFHHLCRHASINESMTSVLSNVSCERLTWNNPPISEETCDKTLGGFDLCRMHKWPDLGSEAASGRLPGPWLYRPWYTTPRWSPKWRLDTRGGPSKDGV